MPSKEGDMPITRRSSEEPPPKCTELCKVCDAPIRTGELCAEHAKGNDPFATPTEPSDEIKKALKYAIELAFPIGSATWRELLAFVGIDVNAAIAEANRRPTPVAPPHEHPKDQARTPTINQQDT